MKNHSRPLHCLGPLFVVRESRRSIVLYPNKLVVGLSTSVTLHLRCLLLPFFLHSFHPATKCPHLVLNSLVIYFEKMYYEVSSEFSPNISFNVGVERFIRLGVFAFLNLPRGNADADNFRLYC